MKPDKSGKTSLKKTVKAASQSLRKKGAAIVARLKPAKAKANAPAAEVAAKAATPKPKRKTAAKVTTAKLPPVPAILLEEPTLATASGPGERYALGPAPARHPGIATAEELPEAYGTQRLLLAARDPHWLYARWDFTPEQLRKYNALSVERHLVLRLFLGEAKGRPVAEVPVHPESTHWFVHVAEAGAKYIAELGYYRAAGKWVGLATSASTLTPPDNMSDDASAQFATIPMDISFAQLMEFAQAVVRQKIPLMEVLQQLRASGHKVPETRVTPVEKWTPERQQALAQIITMDSVRRVWMGSLEITELIRRQLAQEISSLGAAQFSRPTSPGGTLSSLSSAFGGGADRGKGFWFNVNAELIVYGATEPDARVTIGGRVIKLRPDGSFSYRFALPDGEYELPAVAVSADQSDARAAELKFSRSTEYHGDVGRHPQDPALKPPLLANVA